MGAVWSTRAGVRARLIQAVIGVGAEIIGRGFKSGFICVGYPGVGGKRALSNPSRLAVFVATLVNQIRNGLLIGDDHFFL